MPVYLLITNPMSSRGLRERKIARVVRNFIAAGAQVDIHRTIGRGDATAAVAGIRRDYDAIVVAGGDGTVAEVVNGLQGKSIPIGILPRGTGNVLAKELGLPKRLRRAMEVILAGKVLRLDAGIADGRRFLLMASAGYDAQVVAMAHAKRGGMFGKAHYILPILRALAGGKFPPIRVTIHDRPYECHHVVVANVSSYGGPFRPARGAIYNDGEFDVVMFTRPGRYNMVRYGFAAMTMSDAPRDDILRVRTDSVDLSSTGNVPLQFDGDPAGFLPRRLRIRRDEVAVIVP